MISDDFPTACRENGCEFGDANYSFSTNSDLHAYFANYKKKGKKRINEQKKVHGEKSKKELELTSLNLTLKP